MNNYLAMFFGGIATIGMICILTDMIINKGDFYDDRFDN